MLPQSINEALILSAGIWGVLERLAQVQFYLHVKEGTLKRLDIFGFTWLIHRLLAIPHSSLEPNWLWSF